MGKHFLLKFRFQILLGIVLTYMAIVPFLERSIFLDVVSTLILISAVAVTLHRRSYVLGYALVAAAAISAIWYARWFPSRWILVTSNLLDLLFMVLVVGAILSHVLRSHKVTRETIAGALIAYLFLGIMWADVFSLVENFVPGSFSIDTTALALSGQTSPRSEVAYFSYFSFVTLSTLGYGDITPVTRPARMLAALEAILGQLYIAVLIASLVSKYLAAETKENP